MLVWNKLVLLDGLEEVTVEYCVVEGGGFVEKVEFDQTTDSYEVTVEGPAEGSNVDVTAVSSSLGDGEDVELIVVE